MDISTFANLINAIAVTAGVIFAAAQIRDYRRQRKRDSMLALVRSFQSPTFAKGLRRVIELPDNTTADEIRKILGPDGEDLLIHVTATWETWLELVQWMAERIIEREKSSLPMPAYIAHRDWP